LTLRLPFALTVCGLGELAAQGERRVSHAISILDPDAPVPDELADAAALQKLELRFHDIINERQGMQCPRPEHIERLLGFVRLLPREAAGVHLLVHCHAGFSRSPAAAILVLASTCPHMSAAQIVEEMKRIRADAWPNLRMLEIGDTLLRRRGSLIEAARRLYKAELERKPEFADLLRDFGRGREVELARRTAA